MLVVDTSIVLAAVTEAPEAERAQERLAPARRLHAPHLIDVEIVHALRRMVLSRELRAPRARAALEDFGSLRITRYAHAPLQWRMWELRDNLTAYDAAFVALSEALDMPLLTVDARLARASGHGARVELV